MKPQQAGQPIPAEAHEPGRQVIVRSDLEAMDDDPMEIIMNKESKFLKELQARAEILDHQLTLPSYVRMLLDGRLITIKT